MFLHEMKHYSSENVIELKITSRLDNKKNANFKNNEPIRLTGVGDNILIASLNDVEKNASVLPINEFTKSTIDQIFGAGMPKLVEVISHDKHVLQVLVKRFPEERMLDYSINLSDEFLRKLKYQVELRNLSYPKKDIEEATIYVARNFSYAVIGVHIRADKKKKFNNFVIAAKDYYIHVKKEVDELEREFYFADKITNNITKDNYKFFLAKGNLKYTDEKEIIQRDTLAEMEKLSDDTYIKIWNEYGAIERKQVIDKARALQSIHYTSFEPEGNKCRFDVIFGSEKKLCNFQKEFSKGDMLAICLFNPFERQLENEEFSQFLKKNKKFIVNVKLAEEIDVESGCLFFIVEEEKIPILAKSKSGYIFMSILGDEQRLNRREKARIKIETANCPMPNLSAVLEGKSVTNPKRRNLPAMSELVKDEIFTDKKGNYRPPTEKQELAIEIALNTPDIALIQGPPGTGKTTVITAILKRLNEETDSKGGLFGRNLVTAFQHDAVQNAIDRIEILGLPAIKFGKKYSDIEDDFADINAIIQNWINERLVDLNIKHSDVMRKKHIADFNKLFNNYMYSGNSVEQAISILEEIRDLLDIKLSTDLLNQLNSQIRDLKYMTRGKVDADLISLIRAIRRIPTNEVAFSDDGRFELEIAVSLLKQQNNDAFTSTICVIEKMQKTGRYDFSTLRSIRKELLVQVLPKEKVFTSRSRKSDITILLSQISNQLLEQIEGGKNGEELVILQYIQSLEDNPLAVKDAILDYTSVNGATNQQVMRREISMLKGGNIVYDNVLVDEAARSNPLDLFIPLSIAKDRIILVGDHRQLPHIVDDEIVNDLERSTGMEMKETVEQRIKESMFEHLFTKLKILEAADGIKRTITLDKQFRMHPSLGDFINDNFYEKYSESEHVGNGIEDPTVFSHQLPGIENKACIWYDVPLEMGKEKSGKSKSRKIEAVKIAKHLKNMLDYKKEITNNYGIITFYREQVNIINKELYNVGIFVKDEYGNYVLSSEYWNGGYGNKEYIKVGTVDSFQGMEFDFVYLSIVRSNDKYINFVSNVKDMDRVQRHNVERKLQQKYGFLMYENRLCVAMSRQKKALICVGDSSMLDGNYAEIAVPSLVEYYRLCKEDVYGKIL